MLSDRRGAAAVAAACALLVAAAAPDWRRRSPLRMAAWTASGRKSAALTAMWSMQAPMMRTVPRNSYVRSRCWVAIQ